MRRIHIGSQPIAHTAELSCLVFTTLFVISMLDLRIFFCNCKRFSGGLQHQVTPILFTDTF